MNNKATHYGGFNVGSVDKGLPSRNSKRMTQNIYRIVKLDVWRCKDKHFILTVQIFPKFSLSV